MTVIVSGAGIGGLTVALTCHAAGIPVKVYEQVREIFEPGLEAKLEAIGVRTREVAYFSKKGWRIHAEARGIRVSYKWPQYSIHRGVRCGYSEGVAPILAPEMKVTRD
ncbi:MAG: hypothetical protein L3J37_01915 [Rhodobacteraceae bacterium]|nr:hypothetical protein [Paracoccaceae bacterium]